MAYPTKLFANQADHTYVKCGTGGKAWGCWGGKSGGKQLRQGSGSTKRADCIAQPDEKANIKCYLVNGVCHQAANRILLPAGITVRGARGYSISEALFGTYGRVGFWPCKSPFDTCPRVTGELPQCVATKTRLKATPIRALTDTDKLEWHYIKGVMEIYAKATPLLKSKTVTTAQASSINLELFMYMAEFNLGPLFNRELAKRLKAVRSTTEKARMKIEKPFGAEDISAGEFVEEFDRITLSFQDEMANTLTTEEYMTLFDLKPDERVVLADRKIVARAFKTK